MIPKFPAPCGGGGGPCLSEVAVGPSTGGSFTVILANDVRLPNAFSIQSVTLSNGVFSVNVNINNVAGRVTSITATMTFLTINGSQLAYQTVTATPITTNGAFAGVYTLTFATATLYPTITSTTPYTLSVQYVTC